MRFDAIRKKVLAGERLSRDEGVFLLKDADLLSADLSAAGIGAALAALGARPWQVAITAPIVAQACVDHP